MEHMQRLFVRSLLVAALFGAIGMSTAAPVATGTVNIGWALADQPSATQPYLANSVYSYNSFGKSVTIVPINIGSYSVIFSGLSVATFRNIQINSYKTTGYCLSDGSSYYELLGAASFDVVCYDSTGKLTNSEFALLVQRRHGKAGNVDHGFAFLEAILTRVGTTSTPDPKLQYNSTGGVNTVTHSATGTYTAFFPGLTRTGGHVQVTGHYLEGRCVVKDWKANASGTSADVLCFDKTGAPGDSEFDLAYTIGEPLGFYGIGAPYGAYAWAMQPENTKAYRTFSTYTYNGFRTGPLTSQKTGTGTYAVTIPGNITYSKSIALVTAVGASSNYCNVAGWTHQTINVACFAQGGVPADSQFTVTFQTAP